MSRRRFARTPKGFHNDSPPGSPHALIQTAGDQQQTERSFLDCLCVEHDIDKPSQKLQSPTELDSDAFVAEVKKLRDRRNPATAAALRSLRDEYTRTIEPARQLAAEAASLEHRLSDLVNEAYGLSPEKIDLMWKTAPPRMPIGQHTTAKPL